MWLRDILYDSLFQTVILGPLVGFVFGWLFPNLSGTSESPRDREKIIIKYVTRESVHHYHHRQQSDPNQASSVGLAVLGLSLAAPWLFVLYLDTITYYLWVGLAFVGTLMIGFFVTVFARYGLNDDWLFELALALFLLVVCAWLVSIPLTSIDRSVIDAADESNFWQFSFQRLTPWGQRLVLSQMVGMWFVALTAFGILLRGVHILSLAMADPKNPYGLSSRIALSTMHTARRRGITLIAVLGTIAWYLLVAAQNPDAFIWSIFKVPEM